MIPVVALILLFLLKIQYPSGQPTTTIVHNKYGRDGLQMYRKLETDHYKRQKLELDIKFLNTCLVHEKAPKFLQFKVYRNDFRNTSKYKSWQNHLLHKEIDSQKRKLRKINASYIKSKETFQALVSVLDFWFFMGKIASHTRNVCNKVKLTHDKKLRDLSMAFGMCT